MWYILTSNKVDPSNLFPRVYQEACESSELPDKYRTKDCKLCINQFPAFLWPGLDIKLLRFGYLVSHWECMTIFWTMKKFRKSFWSGPREVLSPCYLWFVTKGKIFCWKPCEIRDICCMRGQVTTWRTVQPYRMTTVETRRTQTKRLALYFLDDSDKLWSVHFTVHKENRTN